MSTKKQSAQGYKKLLLKCLALRKQGGKSAYKRTNLLIQVFENADFRLDNGNLDDLALADVLDQYVEDIFLGETNVFLTLKAMVEHFPNEADWSEGRLRTMFNEMVQARKPAKEVKNRRSATLSEIAELKTQLKREKAKCLRLQREKEELETKLAEALEEVKRLKARLSKAA